MVRAAAEHSAAEASGAVGLGVVAMPAKIRLFTCHLVKESACS
ncbi:Uncharacterised protein [Mycobacteroides abscessus subsp. massiliense]|nr:Uncharacterised protein [Mycobacteroides abscessus]SKE06463.1 Uncharacterised protein [Mycobacteroides abscessus subsp. massiliense]CPX60028.1 Uncharacterised protein [Mycobacteroides abscessus]CPZ30693.1 Uncharacterised protein [Mycobacteroides abscessus]SKE52340.1 Uncharacterised protein [Mycobacteroides abscessus subsp. massiliense]